MHGISSADPHRLHGLGKTKERDEEEEGEARISPLRETPAAMQPQRRRRRRRLHCTTQNFKQDFNLWNRRRVS